MTIKELIEQLSKYDPDTRICVLEHGFEPIDISHLEIGEHDEFGADSVEKLVFVIKD